MAGETETTLPCSTPVHGKISSTKLVPGAEKVGDHWTEEGARSFRLCLPKMRSGTLLVPLVLKTPGKTRECGGDIPIHFLRSAQTFFRRRVGPFPSLISALAVSRWCHRLCPDCGFRHLHLLTWFWLKKEEFLSRIYPIAS